MTVSWSPGSGEGSCALNADRELNLGLVYGLENRGQAAWRTPQPRMCATLKRSPKKQRVPAQWRSHDRDSLSWVNSRMQ
jgi:hypothetical protein